MACVTCGKALDTDFKSIVKTKKLNYEKTGVVYMVYEIKGVWHICKGEYFETIKKTQSVGEFYHISEFKVD